MYTSIKGFIFIEQNGRGFLSLQGYSGLVGKNHENHLHSFAGKTKKILWRVRFLLIVYFIFKAHLVLL